MPSINDQIIEALPHLQRFARFLARNPGQAEDLVQDCVERTLMKSELFQEGTSFRSWMFTMMRNIFLDGTRRKAVVHRHAEAVRHEGPTRTDPSQFQAVLLSRTHAAIESLSKEEREVVMNLAVKERSYQELAAENGVPMGTMKSRLSRARGKLRQAVLAEERPAGLRTKRAEALLPALL